MWGLFSISRTYKSNQWCSSSVGLLNCLLKATAKSRRQCYWLRYLHQLKKTPEFSASFPEECRITESLRLEGPSSQSSLPKQDHIQGGFEYLQRRRFHDTYQRPLSQQSSLAVQLLQLDLHLKIALRRSWQHNLIHAWFTILRAGKRGQP